MEYTYLDCLAQMGIGGAHPGGLQLTKKLLQQEKVNHTATILDVGCGTGQTAAYISQNYQSDVWTLDNNKIMIEKARQRFSSLNLPIQTVVGSIEKLPFNDNAFDLILSESVIAFTNCNLSLSECKRVLKPGGVLLAIEMVKETPLTVEEEEEIIRFYGVEQLYTESEWCEQFSKAGFQFTSSEPDIEQVDQIDVGNAPDFLLSENVAEIYFEILEEHEFLIKKYKHNLGYRIFRCHD